MEICSSPSYVFAANRLCYARKIQSVKWLRVIIKGVYVQLITTLGWQLSMVITEQEQENVHETINKDIKMFETNENASNAKFLPTSGTFFFLNPETNLRLVNCCVPDFKLVS